jgi:nucleoside-diphosphate-sugar epimerase
MKAQSTVLVTGPDGFVGRHLVPYLAGRGYKVTAASRTKTAFEQGNPVAAPLPDLAKPADWEPLFQLCNAIVHLAGIAHRPVSDDLYDSVNQQATVSLARPASHCGIDHLIFVSSIAVRRIDSSAICALDSKFQFGDSDGADKPARTRTDIHRIRSKASDYRRPHLAPSFLSAGWEPFEPTSSK